jgi:hypothetical protein
LLPSVTREAAILDPTEAPTTTPTSEKTPARNPVRAPRNTASNTKSAIKMSSAAIRKILHGWPAAYAGLFVRAAC